VFYAFSGGQESDTGTIGSVPVANAVTRENSIVYTLAADHELQPGDNVIITIDWDRRYRLMRLHFAAEIVLWLFMERFPGIEKIGAHISPSKSRIDFRRDEPITSVLPKIQTDINEIVARDMQIVSAYSDEKTEKRYWKIPGLGSIPCGGIHLRSTGEIGQVVLSRKNIGKGKERVEIVLAE
jgi:Ser-tRNA(Ala) deacylase AlaX